MVEETQSESEIHQAVVTKDAHRVEVQVEVYCLEECVFVVEINLQKPCL